MNQRIEAVIKKKQDIIFAVSDFIFEHPEAGDEEYQSSEYLARLLRKNGFDVTYPYLGIQTAFRADFGDDTGPKAGFLAEYDALPGYGQDNRLEHACGHNWIGALAVGTALVLAEMKDSFQGKIVVFGTPAEETAGRKIDMANAGAFDDIDAAFQLHLYENSNLKARALAMDAVEFKFKGRSSHASVYPERGINALDAVQLTFTGINYLRQQLKPDARIHGIITDGGEAPNIIPEKASCLFYVRAARKAYFQEIFEKVKNCARGAALMTGAELEINLPENAYDDLIVNPVLAEIVAKNMELAGFEPLSQVEEIPGSTDVGNVSYKCPTLYGNVGIGEGKIKVHEEGFAEIANGPEAKERLIQSIQVLAGSAMALYESPELVSRVKAAFDEEINKKEFER